MGRPQVIIVILRNSFIKPLRYSNQKVRALMGVTHRGVGIGDRGQNRWTKGNSL
jgi:hypothetical protein